MEKRQLKIELTTKKVLKKQRAWLKEDNKDIEINNLYKSLLLTFQKNTKLRTASKLIKPSITSELRTKGSRNHMRVSQEI